MNCLWLVFRNLFMCAASSDMVSIFAWSPKRGKNFISDIITYFIENLIESLQISQVL